MRICLVGKYPPIEGGVSTETYWIARSLAERGHQVHVVTNALDIEPAFRSELGPDDAEWYSGPVAGGGRVDVHTTPIFDARALSYVPQANPFVSRLAGLATEVVETHGCDVVFAYYFEPYAVAGWLAATWTRRPLVVKHAGSDLDRLMRSPELATTYKRVLRSAEAVVTQRHLMPRFVGFGVPRQRLVTAPALPVPPELFSPNAEPMTVSETGLPAIGIYGKIGRSKGTFDLVAALGRLAGEGCEFELLAMIGATQGEWLAPALGDALRERTRVLPLVPHWRVPSFIRSCTAVCFLERGFPVAIHGPIVAREVLACGICLVLSGEIAAKQAGQGLFETGRNLVVVDDPRDHHYLAAALRQLIAEPGLAARIGRAGRELSRMIEPDVALGADWEAIVERAVARIAAAKSDAPAAADLVAPGLRALVDERWPALAQELEAVPNEHDPFEVARAWCVRVGQRLDDLPDERDRTRLGACLRYQGLRLDAESDNQGPLTGFGIADALGGRSLAEAADRGLVPMCVPAVKLETFDADVAMLLTESETGSPNLHGDSVHVLFRQTPNLVARELAVDEATIELLGLCNGVNTVDDVIRGMALWFGVDGETATEGVLAALKRLHEADVIVFADRVPTPSHTVAMVEAI
jgi:glycosyltransferase involved in cell wall biosynthesis